MDRTKWSGSPIGGSARGGLVKLGMKGAWWSSVWLELPVGQEGGVTSGVR